MRREMLFGLILGLVLIISNAKATTYLNDCSALSTQNENYVLTQNISSNDTTCIFIDADNIIFDCNGYSITDISENSNSPAIYSENHNNITIKNCNIYNYINGVNLQSNNNTYIENFKTENCIQGIYTHNSNELYIYNSSFYDSYYGGINLDINNNIYINETKIYNVQHQGINIHNTNNVHIDNTEIYNSTQGINIYNNTNNVHIDNTEIYNSNIGINIYDYTNNVYVNNIEIYNCFQGLSLTNSENNIITNSNFYNNSFEGIRTYNSNNIYANNLTIIDTEREALVLEVGDNITIENSYLEGNATEVGIIWILDMTNGIIKNTIINATSYADPTISCSGSPIYIRGNFSGLQINDTKIHINGSFCKTADIGFDELSKDITISNVTVECSKDDLCGSDYTFYGFEVSWANNVRISNFKTINTFVGLTVEHLHNFTIEDIDIQADWRPLYIGRSDKGIVNGGKINLITTDAPYITPTSLWFIETYFTNETTIKNVQLINNSNVIYYPFRIKYSNNITIFNETATYSPYYGMNIQDSNYTNLSNIHLSGIEKYGVYFRGTTHDGILEYSDINGSDYNVYIDPTSSKNSIVNTNLINSKLADIWINPDNENKCLLNINNVYGSDGKPIIFVNTTNNLNNTDYDEIILCNGDDTKIINSTSNHIIARFSNNVSFYNSTFNKYNVTDSILNVYWLLTINNQLSSLVKIYDKLNNLISEFSDTTKELWLKEYEVVSGNNRIDYSPYTITATKTNYKTGNYVIDMNKNMLLSISLPLLTTTTIPTGFLIYWNASQTIIAMSFLIILVTMLFGFTEIKDPKETISWFVGVGVFAIIVLSFIIALLGI